MSQTRQNSRKSQIIGRLMRSIQTEGEITKRDVVTEGIFVRDPHNSHYRFYSWDELPQTHLEGIWESRKTNEEGLMLSFVLYVENGQFKPACGLAVRDRDWYPHFGFTEAGTIMPTIEDILGENLHSPRQGKER